MITKQSFETWLKDQLTEFPEVDFTRVREVRFTLNSVYKEPQVCIEVEQIDLNEKGQKYIGPGNDVACTVHVIPVKSLT